MKFDHQYKTKDGLFLVQMNKENLVYKELRCESNRIFVSDNITVNTIYTYNTNTYKVSDKSLYLGKNGKLYFNGRVDCWGRIRRYYIDDLVPVGENDESNND
jgi:hypothetical protein